jgi:hypothetical protein
VESRDITVLVLSELCSGSALESATVSTIRELRSLLRFRPLQLAALAAFLTFIGGFAFYTKLCVLDNDIWWHLKVGDWIVAHRAVPHTGILSRTAAVRPWVAYSWGYEVLMSSAYRWLGLVGIGLYGTFLTIAVAYTVYWMLCRLSGQFWIALLLASFTCWAFLFNGMPRPVFFSMVFFCVTLKLLLEAERTGQVKGLYWLPMIFFIWANLHIQFIYGLFLVGLLVATTIGQRLASMFGLTPKFLQRSKLPITTLLAVFGACVLATLLGPNFYHLYAAIYGYSKAKFPYKIIIELQPLSFLESSNYVQLALTAFGFFAVGWRRKIDLFKLSMLIICSVVAYRTMRDAWFIAIPAAACIADFPSPKERRNPAENWMENLGIAAVVAILLVLVSRGTDFTSRELDRAISSAYPVNAVNFLRQNPQPGPLYNNLDWGGFLMWYMPDDPVAIDGRNDLYGDQLDELFYASQSSEAGYASDPYLNEAGVVLLSSDLPLAKILTADSRFQLIYQDQLAVVFARR